MSVVGAITAPQTRRLAKESFWIIAGQGAAVLGALFGIRILTEMMSPAAYGQLALGITAATFANQILWGPLGAGAMRFYAPAQEAHQLTTYLTSLRRFILVGAAILLILAGAIVIVAALAGESRWIPLIVPGFVFSVVAGLDSMANGIQTAARQRAVVALHTAISAWGRVLAAAGLMVVLGVSSAVAMYGYAFATIVILVSQYRFLRPVIQAAGVSEGRSRESRGKWDAQIIRYSWPFALSGICCWFQTASDRWALAAFASSSDAGVYVVLYQLSYYPVTLLAVMLVTLVSPIVFHRAGDTGDEGRLQHASRLNRVILIVVLASTALLFLVSLLMHGWIFRTFAASQYAQVSSLMPWLILSGGIFAGGQVLSLEQMSRLDTAGLLAPKVVTALFGGLLNILGAYLYGVKGVVAASLAFSVVYFLWLLLINLRVTYEPGEALQGGPSITGV